MGDSVGEFQAKMAQITADLRRVRAEKKALEEEGKVKVKVTTTLKTEPFKSGRKEELYHPNLDYALAEVAYSPYLLAHLPKYEPDSKTASMLNKMRFMGPKKCESLVANKEVELPCDLNKTKEYVIDEVMTYNPDFGPGVKKPGAKPRTTSSTRPDSSMGGATVKTLLGAGEMERPRSPEYEGAIARGGPERYKKMLASGSLSSLQTTDAGFQSLFADQLGATPGSAAAPSSATNAVPARAQGYYSDRYKFSDEEWVVELARRRQEERDKIHREEAEIERKAAEDEAAREEEAKKRKREKRAQKEAARRAAAAKEAARKAYKERLVQERKELDERRAKEVAEKKRKEEDEVRKAQEAFQQRQKAKALGQAGKAAARKPKVNKEREAKAKAEASERIAMEEAKSKRRAAEEKEQTRKEEEAEKVRKEEQEDLKVASAAALVPEAVAPAPPSQASDSVVITAVTLRDVLAEEWWSPEYFADTIFVVLSLAGWSARIEDGVKTDGNDFVVDNLAVVMEPESLGGELRVRVFDDNAYEGEIEIASALVTLAAANEGSSVLSGVLKSIHGEGTRSKVEISLMVNVHVAHSSGKGTAKEETRDEVAAGEDYGGDDDWNVDN